MCFLKNLKKFLLIHLTFSLWRLLYLRLLAKRFCFNTIYIWSFVLFTKMCFLKNLRNFLLIYLSFSLWQLRYLRTLTKRFCFNTIYFIFLTFCFFVSFDMSSVYTREKRWRIWISDFHFMRSSSKSIELPLGDF